jgi:hypothetical protein
MISLDQLERRWGGLSFPGFLRYYAMLHALVYVLQWARPDLGELLEFDRTKILAGEVWRVVTFLFASSGSVGPGGLGMLAMVFMVMIAFMMSTALEEAWGVFKATLFYACGILGLVVGNFLLPAAMPGSGFLLYGATFFAFATLFPKVEFLLFFILPVQVRFFAWFQAAWMVLMAMGNLWLVPMFLLGNANYLIFAGIPALRGTLRVLESAQRKRRFLAAKEPESEAFHSCALCDRTDETDRDLEFRVGRDGREYCIDHLQE